MKDGLILDIHASDGGYDFTAVNDLDEIVSALYSCAKGKDGAGFCLAMLRTVELVIPRMRRDDALEYVRRLRELLNVKEIVEKKPPRLPKTN